MRKFTIAQITAASLVGLCATALPVTAQPIGDWGAAGWSVDETAQSASYTSQDDTIRIEGGVGAMYLEGNEKVFSGNYTVSHLIWQTTAPVLRGSLAIDLGAFSIRAEGSVAGLGRSHMEDYDWLQGDDTFANWSHRSTHHDTSLDWFYSGGASLGYEVVKDQSAVIRAHAGLKYTDVQWTARGGNYLYSSPGGFRDIAGSIPDGTPGITYRQQLPEVFVGFDGEERFGNVRLGGLLRGGMTFMSKATDDHWLRDLRFVDSLHLAPTVTVGADVGFALGRNVEVTLAARYDHIFEHRGDTQISDIPSGAPLSTKTDTAGAALRSAEFTAGLKGSF